MIPIFNTSVPETAKRRALSVIDSGWTTSGPIGHEVARSIENLYGGDRYAVLTNSCTSGMIAIAMLIGLKTGDEVITSPMSFVATTSCFVNRGAKPVFVDIDKSTGLIDIDKIEEKITEKTKAIWVVNLYGHVPDMKKLSEIADKHDLYLIEDCAHAFESIRDGYRPGTYSDFACFSFYSTKTVHCGEGGAVLSKHKEYIQSISTIIRHGLSKYPQPGKSGNIGYDIIELGYKGNLSDVLAALLLEQIHDSDKNQAIRNNIAQHYYNELKSFDSIHCVMPDDRVESAWYTFPLITPYRDKLMDNLNSAGIGCTIMYQTIESFTIYGKSITCPIAHEFGNTQLSLPCHEQLQSYDIEYIIKNVKQCARTF